MSKENDFLARQKIDETKDDLSSRREELAEILSEALTHGVTDYVAEYTVSTITLPDEKLKEKLLVVKVAIFALLKKLPELKLS